MIYRNAVRLFTAHSITLNYTFCHNVSQQLVANVTKL